LFPILHYQLGNEYYNEVYWAGTAEEYGILLDETKRAALQANSDVKIVLSGVVFEDVYGFYDREMGPKARAFVNEYLPKVPKSMKDYLKRGEDFSRKTLRFCDDYDVFDARWPNYGMVARWKELLRDEGCGDKEIWSAEIYPVPPFMDKLVIPNWTLQGLPAPSNSQGYLKILKKPRHGKFEEVNGWYRAMQAAQVVKMAMVAMDAGARKLMIGWFFDTQTPFAVSSFSHHGLYSETLKQAWPAAHTYKLMISKLGGLRSIRRLPMPADIYVYECNLKGGKKVLVAFHDDHIGQNHDEPLGRIKAEIPFPGSTAQVTPIIRGIDQTTPETQRIPVIGGRISLTLGEYPVFIE
jgi:hypothetical protein